MRGPTAARTAASRPASSPTPTLTLIVSKSACAAAAAAADAPARSSAPIVALTGIERAASTEISCATGRPERRPARSQSARSTAASACGRSRSARQASSAVVLGAVREHLGVGVERRAHGGERHAVVGLERRGLPAPHEPVLGLQPHAQQLPLLQHAPGRPHRLPEPEREGFDAEPHQLARMPAESRRQNASWSCPVPPSAPLSAGPSVRVRTVRTTGDRQRHGEQRQQQPGRERAEQPRQLRGHERAADHRDVEDARALAPQPHRQRALARAPVGLEVADVVDDEDRRGEQADRHGEHERLPLELLDLRVVRAGHRDDAEEQEHEDLAEALVAVGPRPAGVEHAGEDRGRADQQQLPARGRDQVGAGEHGQRRTRRRSRPAPGAAARARPRSPARARAGPRCRRRGGRRSSRWRGSCPTWMNSAPSSAARKVRTLKVSSVAASAVPTSTGATAAGSVRGRAAISQMRAALGRSGRARARHGRGERARSPGVRFSL